MYLLLLFSCLPIVSISALELRIYSGNDVDPSELGYLALLHIVRSGKDERAIKCSGSIIGCNWVITAAAHCLPVDKPIKRIDVQQHYDKPTRTLATVSPTNLYEHPKFVHGNYTFPNSQYDIALLKTTEKILFDDIVTSIDLASLSPTTNQSAIIAGYGQNEFNQTSPLQGVVTIAKCPSGNYRYLLCSNSKVKSGHGDSGGPLASKGKLVGVISGIANKGCNQTNTEKKCTTIYVNVASHYKWIKKIMKSHS